MELIKIKWIDAMSDTNGWRTIEDAITWGEEVPDEIDQSGYVINETDEYILLANKINLSSIIVSQEREYNNDIVQGLTKIPIKYIISKEIIK